MITLHGVLETDKIIDIDIDILHIDDNIYKQQHKNIKILIKIGNICDMKYVWFMDRNATIYNLINKLKKVYKLNIDRINKFDISENILSLLLYPNNNNNNNNCISIKELVIKNNGHIFKMESIINCQKNVVNENILKSDFLYKQNIFCPLKCELSCNDNNKCGAFYNDIPSKKEILEFISSICCESESEQDQKDIKQIYLEIELPERQLIVNHNEEIFHFYGFKDILYLYNDKDRKLYSESNIVNNNYMDILKLLNIKDDIKYTFMDNENKYFELDLYQEIQSIQAKEEEKEPENEETKEIDILYTMPLNKGNNKKEMDFCVICQEDNVLHTEFCRINSCHHLYHYRCIKQYLQYENANNINNNSQQIQEAQCPLCRKPFNLIQVHNDMVLQTLNINNPEFHDNNNYIIPPSHHHQIHVSQDSDILLFSDLDDNDNDIHINSNYNHYNNGNSMILNNNLSAPQISELDEFYRMGLSLINSNSIPRSNGSSVIHQPEPSPNNGPIVIDDDNQNMVHDTSPPEILILSPDNNLNGISPIPSIPDREPIENTQEQLQTPINIVTTPHTQLQTRNTRTQSNVSMSYSYSDPIGRLSLSGVSTSATIGYEHDEKQQIITKPTRPSLRYIYSPKPLIIEDTDDRSIGTPTPRTPHSQTIPFNILDIGTKRTISTFSNLSSTSTVNLNGMNIVRPPSLNNNTYNGHGNESDTGYSDDERSQCDFGSTVLTPASTNHNDDNYLSIGPMRLFPIDSAQSINSAML